MLTLQEELANIEIGEAQSFRNITLIPFMRRSEPAGGPDYLLLDDGIARGDIRVTEINDGCVPELLLENKADLPVLLLDGEELVGAKQNRTLNLTILVAAKCTTRVPVSCVEAGRWAASSREMMASNHVMYSMGRAARVAHVTNSMRVSGARSSDQSAVWRDIAAKATRLGSSSPTGAMSAIFERHASSVDEFTRAFAWQSGQCGVAFAIGGKLLGLELFDCSEVMRKFFPKLVRSYALDALDTPSNSSESVSGEAIKALVAQIGAAESFADKALGLGKDVRFSGPEVSGAALWAQERYVHLCAFAQHGERPDTSNFWTRMTSMSRRYTFLKNQRPK